MIRSLLYSLALVILTYSLLALGSLATESVSFQIENDLQRASFERLEQLERHIEAE